MDAWFDILTSSSTSELVVAVTEAALVELPLAAVCLLLARKAERRLLERSDAESASARPRLRLVGGERATSGGSGRPDRLSA